MKHLKSSAYFSFLQRLQSALPWYQRSRFNLIVFVRTRIEFHIDKVGIRKQRESIL